MGVMSGADEQYNIPATLEALCRKVEVGRTVHAAYRADWIVATPELIAPPYVAALAAVLLHRADTAMDAKLLNAALKILDGHLRQPNPVFTSGLRELALRVLTRVCSRTR